MSYLLARDAVSGKEGTAYMTINGRQVELFGAKKITFDADVQVAKLKVVGTRVTQSKITGIEYSGSMTIYYGTPEFLNMVKALDDSGVMPYFSLVVQNDDPASSVGTQTLFINNVVITGKIPLAMLDADADMLSIEVPFSATGVTVEDAFTSPTTLGGFGGAA